MRKPTSKKAKRCLAALAVLLVAVFVFVGNSWRSWYESFPEVHKRGADIVTQTNALFETKAWTNWHGSRVQDAVKRSGRKDIRVDMDNDSGAEGMITKISVIKGDLLVSFNPYNNLEDEPSITVDITYPGDSPVNDDYVLVMSSKSKFRKGSDSTAGSGLSPSDARKLANQVVWDVLNTVANNWQE
jgi:archaellum component FlaF (FlaF/FlaG flagellin family)